MSQPETSEARESVATRRSGGALRERVERALFIAICLQIGLLALVNAGFGGRDRLGLLAVALLATAVLWLISRRFRVAMPSWPGRRTDAGRQDRSDR